MIAIREMYIFLFDFSQSFDNNGIPKDFFSVSLSFSLIVFSNSFFDQNSQQRLSQPQVAYYLVDFHYREKGDKDIACLSGGKETRRRTPYLQQRRARDEVFRRK